MKISNNITELIGKTPLVKINNIFNDQFNTTILAKMESFNPLSSVKDRVAFEMIEDGEREGKIDKDTFIIEPTSGNTGIGLAYICAVKGYKLIITMPETVSMERMKLLKFFGAEVILTDGTKGMAGAVDEAKKIAFKYKNSFILNQFSNIANVNAHKKTTALEIWQDTDESIDILVAGVGTGGTITGVGEVLKEKKTSIKIIAVEPKLSPVLSGGKPAPHKIEGIGSGFIPSILNRTIIDEIIAVSEEDAFATSRDLAQKEGILVGKSSGAAMFAALQIAKKIENKGKIIVVVLPDTGERYISTSLFDWFFIRTPFQKVEI